jgi:N-acetylneuraminic acid mutarotase
VRFLLPLATFRRRALRISKGIISTSLTRSSKRRCLSTATKVKAHVSLAIKSYLTRSAFYLLLLGVCAIPFAVAQRSFNSRTTSAIPSKQTQRTLTFTDRVAYQRAIEEVYWRHRIWPKENPDPKPPMDAGISQAELEKKVQDYLRDSQTLEHYWHRPITADQLQAEMDRMAQHTKQPKVLRDVFEALENDPFVIAECLARPILTERLLSNQYESVDRGPSQRTQIGLKESWPVKTENQISDTVTVPNSGYSLPTIADVTDSCTDTWTATAIAPFTRYYHTAVWTGTEMIVWGGLCTGCTDYPNTGGRYNPSTDNWTATSTANAPSGRWGHTAVWTGSEMIIWGGVDPFSVATGARYNPATNGWIATSTTNAPLGGIDHTAIWTGSEMIIWGVGNDGGKYNPNTNSWTATSNINAPALQSGPSAVWTGNEMIVWGCSDIDPLYGFCNKSAGGKYNPSTDNWIATSDINAPTGRRYGQTAVWTGTEMIVWGGFTGIIVNTGGRYNPSSDSWTATSTINASSERVWHTAIWTGSEMIVWGGLGNSFPSINTGGKYNPVTDSWTATGAAGAPSPRDSHTAVWTGSEMLVWGGSYSTLNKSSLDTGGRYCAQSGSTPRYDFNGDGYADYVLNNASTRQTAIWYLNNNVYIRSAYGPTLTAGWGLVGVEDFNRDGHPDYALLNPNTHATSIWYLSNNVYVNGAYGPSLPSGWQLVGTGDFNGDGKPDYALYNASTRQTAIWYLNNNVYVRGAYGPTLAADWSLVGLADFDGDGKIDYLLFNSTTQQSAIWYLNNNVFVRGVYGPTIASGWALVGTADFNLDGHPDYVLYNPASRQTAIWYLSNNVFVSGALGPTLPAGWTLAAP